MGKASDLERRNGGSPSMRVAINPTDAAAASEKKENRVGDAICKGKGIRKGRC